MAGKSSFTPAFDAFRFYADGTEAGSSPLDNQGVNVTVDLAGGDQQVQLRVRIQETGGADGASTDDWQLEYQLNGAGEWTAITAGTTRVRADTGSSLTDGGATTNRGTNGITDGSGSFVAGEQEAGNGQIEDSQLTTSNFTEHVFALIIDADDNANGDTLGFRIALNGGSPGMTNSVTPVITAQLPVTASGGVSSSVPTLSGTGVLTRSGSGAIDATVPTLSGTGALRRTGSGAIDATVPTLSGSGAVVITASGGVSAGVPTLSGTGTSSAAPPAAEPEAVDGARRIDAGSESSRRRFEQMKQAADREQDRERDRLKQIVDDAIATALGEKPQRDTRTRKKKRRKVVARLTPDLGHRIRGMMLEAIAGANDDAGLDEAAILERANQIIDDRLRRERLRKINNETMALLLL